MNDIEIKKYKKIANKIGPSIFTSFMSYQENYDIEISWDAIKSLQDKMLKDSCFIKLEICETCQDKPVVYANTFGHGGDSDNRVSAPTEKEAIIKLFCEVYKIT